MLLYFLSNSLNSQQERSIVLVHKFSHKPSYKNSHYFTKEFEILYLNILMHPMKIENLVLDTGSLSSFSINLQEVLYIWFIFGLQNLTIVAVICSNEVHNILLIFHSIILFIIRKDFISNFKYALHSFIWHANWNWKERTLLYFQLTLLCPRSRTADPNEDIHAHMLHLSIFY